MHAGFTAIALRCARSFSKGCTCPGHGNSSVDATPGAMPWHELLEYMNNESTVASDRVSGEGSAERSAWFWSPTGGYSPASREHATSSGVPLWKKGERVGTPWVVTAGAAVVVGAWSRTAAEVHRAVGTPWVVTTPEMLLVPSHNPCSFPRVLHALFKPLFCFSRGAVPSQLSQCSRVWSAQH